MEDKSSAPSVDAEMIAADIAIIRGGFNTVTINTSRKTEDLLDALKNNRGRLQVLKTEYTNAVKSDGGVQSQPSGKRRMIFHEIMRTYGAMEGLKNELTQRGASFDIDVNDHEHPNAAYKRITTPPTSNSFGVAFWYVLLSVAVFFLWFLTTTEWGQVGYVDQERATLLRTGR